MPATAFDIAEEERRRGPVATLSPFDAAEQERAATLGMSPFDIAEQERAAPQPAPAAPEKPWYRKAEYLGLTSEEMAKLPAWYGRTVVAPAARATVDTAKKFLRGFPAAATKMLEARPEGGMLKLLNDTLAIWSAETEEERQEALAGPRPIAEFWRKQAFKVTKPLEAAEKRLAEVAHPGFRTIGELFTDPDTLIATVAGAIPYTGGAITAHIAGGPGAAFMFGHSVFYEQARTAAEKDGATPAQAELTGQAVGITCAAIETLQVMHIIEFASGGAKRSLVTRAVQKLFKNPKVVKAMQTGAGQLLGVAVGESLEESTQQLTEELGPAIIYNKEIEGGIWGLMGRGAGAGVIGGTTGVLLAGLGAGFRGIGAQPEIAPPAAPEVPVAPPEAPVAPPAAPEAPVRPPEAPKPPPVAPEPPVEPVKPPAAEAVAMPAIETAVEVTGEHHGQLNGNIKATVGGKAAGVLQWAKYGDEVQIQWVEVPPEARRQGIGSKLVEQLNAEFPDANIKWSSTTPEGTALREAVEEPPAPAEVAKPPAAAPVEAKPEAPAPKEAAAPAKPAAKPSAAEVLHRYEREHDYIRQGTKWRKTKQNRLRMEAQRADVEYQRLLKAARAERRKVTIAARKAGTAELKAEALEAQRRGELTAELASHIPIDLLDADIRESLQAHAAFIRKDADSWKLRQKLQAVIEGRNELEGVRQVKERILRILALGQEDYTKPGGLIEPDAEVAEKLAGPPVTTEVAPTKKPAPKPKPEAPAVPEIEKVPGPWPEAVPLKATKSQLSTAHKIAKAKALLSEKGKPRPGYRKLAKAMTGKTSMAKMTQPEAAEFIRALERLPEPTYKKGRLVPPSIPRTTRLAAPGEFDVKFRKPGLIRIITPQNYYAEVLGVSKYTRPLEAGKQRFDLEYRKASREVDRWIADIDKSAGTTIAEKTRAKAKNRPTKAVSRMWELLNEYEEAPAELNVQDAEIFNRFRDLTRRTLERENEIRRSLDIEPIQKRQAYVRHVADGMAKEMLEGRYPFPEGTKYWAERVVGQKVYNPMEMQRKLSGELEDIFTKDLGFATKSMLWTGLKEVHLSKPLRFFSEQLGAISKDMPTYRGMTAEEIARFPVMPASTKKWLVDYVNTIIKGHQTQLDEHVNRIVTETGIGGLFNRILKPFGRRISGRPVTRLFRAGGRVVISGVMGWRPKQLIRNKFQSVQNLALYTIKANLKGFLPANAQMREMMDKSLFLKSYTGIEELPPGAMKKLERAWLAPFQWTASSNAKRAMKVAYWDTLELITESKYKEYGWADPQRTYKEKPGVLYPSERAKLLREMEFGASATQYQYIPMGMPEVFRHKALIPATRLQSWWMNHFAKFTREYAHRAFKGETMYGAKLPWSRRLGALRYLILGGLILNTLGYWRSYLFGVAPNAMAPALQLAISAYVYLTSIASGAPDSPWKRKKEAEAKYRFLRALKTFIPGYLAYRDIYAVWSGERSLKSLFFYTKWTKKAKRGKPRPQRARRTRR